MPSHSFHNVKLYIKVAERQLNNTGNCRPLPNDLTKMNNDTVNKTIKRFQKEYFIKDSGTRINKTKP